jgi:hypothetical protein
MSVKVLASWPFDRLLKLSVLFGPCLLFKDDPSFWVRNDSSELLILCNDNSKLQWKIEGKKGLIHL